MKKFLSDTKTFEFRIESVSHTIANLFNLETDFRLHSKEKRNYTTDNYLGVDIDSTRKMCLNKKLINIESKLNLGENKLTYTLEIMNLLCPIDGYLFEEFKNQNFSYIALDHL